MIPSFQPEPYILRFETLNIPERRGPILLSELMCTETDSHILQCPTGRGSCTDYSDTCMHREDVAVACVGKSCKQKHTGFSTNVMYICRYIYIFFNICFFIVFIGSMGSA